MRKGIIAVILCAIALNAAAPAPARAADDTKKAIAILLALGLGIAAAKKAAEENGDEWDTDFYGEPFSPHADVICLPKPRKCYDHGRLSYRWTRRIFG